MKERPILFSAPMVNAILDGRKTQTRRILKVQPPRDGFQLLRCISSTGPKKDEGKLHWGLVSENKLRVIESDARYFDPPYGQIGDRLWVRESIQALDDFGSPIQYCADNEIDYDTNWVWKKLKLPSIHCPREMSRITLEITNVRAERLNAISVMDAIEEGCWSGFEKGDMRGAKCEFYNLWESINGDGSWDLNPWVWVIEFKRV